jgi:hypothetical protein
VAGRAILAAVQWANDNAVLLAFLVGLVAVLASLVVLALRGWTAYKQVKVASTTLAASGAALAEDVNRLSEALAALPERQAELQQAITDLQRRAAAVGVLARHTVIAQRILRRPLWFVGL